MTDPFDPALRGGELVFYDLEFTAWPGSQERDWCEDWEWREIIQIGAVRVKDDASLTEINRLLMPVMPVINPVLSEYIIELTGISQEDLDEEGFEFPEALDVLLDFCKGARAVLSYGEDTPILGENCKFNKIKTPDLSRFSSIQFTLGDRLGPEFSATSSHSLPVLAGSEPVGDAHDALNDSLSIAQAIRALRQQGRV